MEIQIGDRVRSYDFEGRKDNYIEGTVRDIIVDDGRGPFDGDRYQVEVERVVWDNEDFTGKVAGAPFVFPPVNGTRKLFGGETNGVELIIEGERAGPKWVQS
jgi:hypothetical protein